MKDYLVVFLIFLSNFTHITLGCQTDVLGATNFVKNGDFQKPKITNGVLMVSTPGNVKDWKSQQSQLGIGSHYNSRWTSQVIELTANKNVAYSQIITAPSGRINFKVQCAARKTFPPQTFGFRIWWNNEIIFDLYAAQDYEIHNYTFDLLLNGNQGNITLEGTSRDPKDGMTCDNVQIRQILAPLNRTREQNSCPCMAGHYDNFDGSFCPPCSGWDANCRSCARQVQGNPSSPIKCSQCIQGYYPAANGRCQMCRKLIDGCLKCSGGNCLQCSTSNGFTLNNANKRCQCSPNQFSMQMACVLCSSLDTNCLSCERTSVTPTISCKKCSEGFFIAPNKKCKECSSQIAMCQKCSQDGSTCSQCSQGYFINTDNRCSVCSQSIYGCLKCSQNGQICNQCSNGHGFMLNATDRKCYCQENQFPIQMDCIQCTEIDVHCFSCAKVGTQTHIDDPYFGVECNRCQEGFYFNETDRCSECHNSISGCTKCTQNGNICHECMDIEGFSLNTTDFQCYCSANEYPLKTSCQLCTDIDPQCSSCYTVSETGVCSLCFDGFFLESLGCHQCSNLHEHCVLCHDLGFECQSCIKSFFPSGKDCLHCNTTHKGCIDCSLDGQTCFQCDIEDNFVFNEHKTHCRRTLQCLPEESLNSSLFTHPSVPRLNYSNGDCEQLLIFQKLEESIVYLSYVTLFFSIVSAKIVGVQLFGVLQFAFFNLANYKQVNLFLSPLLLWRTINGYNLPIKFNYFFSNKQNVLPQSFKSMGYSQSFLENMNVMVIVFLGQLLLSFVLTILSKVFPIMRIVSQFFFKQIFITLVMFNCFNISVSATLHFTYASEQNTSYFLLSTILAAVCVFLILTSAIFMQFTKPNGYGQFKLKMKKNYMTRFYIPLSIFGRLFLGFWFVEGQNHPYHSLISVSVLFSFLIYSLVNLPFLQTYQNYRSIMCQIIEIIIIFVGKYYQNSSSSQKHFNFIPAKIKICCLLFCSIVSIICLGYEIYLYLKRALAKRTNKIDRQSPKKQEYEIHHNRRYEHTQHSFSNEE